MPASTLSQSRPRPFLRLAQLVHAEWTRGGALGFLETLMRLFGVALRYRAHRRWLGIVGGPTTRRILEVFPRIALRHSTSYLFANATWAQRMQMLCSHYDFLNRTLSTSFFDKMIDGHGACLWQTASDGHSMAIHLLGPCLETKHREGELMLSFSMDRVPLSTIAFSLVPAAALGCGLRSTELLIYVGQVQGHASRIELLRHASHCCQDILAHDLLMSALAGMAKAWEIDGLLGVPSTLQLAAGSMARSLSSFDYDAFWSRYHAVSTAGGHAFIAIPFAEKAIVDIAAKHRGRTLRKRAFKERVSAACAAVMVEARRGAFGDES